MKVNSVVRSDLTISSMYILFRSIMFFPTKSCSKTTLFYAILVQSWAMLHIPRYISSSSLRLSNFFIPFGRSYAGEVFDIKSSAGSLCFQESASKVPKIRLFLRHFLNICREGWCVENTKAGNKLCNLTKTALFICFWMLFPNQYVHCFYCSASASSPIDLPSVFLATLVQLNLCILSNKPATSL